MNKQVNTLVGRLSLLSLAVAHAFPAMAQELDAERVEMISELAEPSNEVHVGLGYLSEAGRRFGMYSGLRENELSGRLDVRLVRQDRDFGSSLNFFGRNLAQDGREVQFEYARQGHWRYLLGYSETARYEPFVVNTRLTGIGTEALTIKGEAVSRPVDFKMKRALYSIGAEHAMGKDNMVRVRFTHETKSGERLFGRGAFGNGSACTNPLSSTNPFGCPTAVEFLAEPIERTTETLEVSFGRVTSDYQVSAGYYGTLFVNHAERLDVSSPDLNGPASTVGSTPPFSPLAMFLSNDSHQLYLTGGYNLTPLTRAALKTSYTVAQQNENFISVSPAATLSGAPVSLKGRVDTLIAYADLTSMEFDRLDLQANVRYEDRNDKTPEAQYMSPSTTLGATNAGVTGFNKPRSWSSLKSKLEAGYQLPEQFKAVATWELDQQRRSAPEPYRKVNFRTETDESTMRVELKRPILDTVSGALGYYQGRRTGSSYLLDTYTGATSPDVSVNPLLFADRDRHGWKATVDWAPGESWAVHAVHEQSSDHYEGMALGPRDGARLFSSIDASYALSERWHAHLWWSRDDTRADQATRTGAGQNWQAKLRQLSEGVGAGIQGKTRGGIEMGVDVSYSDQSAEQRMSALTGSAITSLPDLAYRLTELKAFGVYPLDGHSGLRADYVFNDLKTDDWTWDGWTYSDGTTLTQDPRQRTHFIGASYYYRWR